MEDVESFPLSPLIVTGINNGPSLLALQLYQPGQHHLLLYQLKHLPPARDVALACLASEIKRALHHPIRQSSSDLSSLLEILEKMHSLLVQDGEAWSSVILPWIVSNFGDIAPVGVELDIGTVLRRLLQDSVQFILHNENPDGMAALTSVAEYILLLRIEDKKLSIMLQWALTCACDAHHERFAVVFHSVALLTFVDGRKEAEFASRAKVDVDVMLRNITKILRKQNIPYYGIPGLIETYITAVLCAAKAGNESLPSNEAWKNYIVVYIVLMCRGMLEFNDLVFVLCNTHNPRRLCLIAALDLSVGFSKFSRKRGSHKADVLTLLQGAILTALANETVLPMACKGLAFLSSLIGECIQLESMTRLPEDDPLFSLFSDIDVLYRTVGAFQQAIRKLTDAITRVVIDECLVQIAVSYTLNRGTHPPDSVYPNQSLFTTKLAQCLLKETFQRSPVTQERSMRGRKIEESFLSNLVAPCLLSLPSAARKSSYIAALKEPSTLMAYEDIVRLMALKSVEECNRRYWDLLRMPADRPAIQKVLMLLLVSASDEDRPRWTECWSILEPILKSALQSGDIEQGALAFSVLNGISLDSPMWSGDLSRICGELFEISLMLMEGSDTLENFTIGLPYSLCMTYVNFVQSEDLRDPFTKNLIAKILNSLPSSLSRQSSSAAHEGQIPASLYRLTKHLSWNRSREVRIRSNRGNGLLSKTQRNTIAGLKGESQGLAKKGSSRSALQGGRLVVVAPSSSSSSLEREKPVNGWQRVNETFVYAREWTLGPSDPDLGSSLTGVLRYINFIEEVLRICTRNEDAACALALGLIKEFDGMARRLELNGKAMTTISQYEEHLTKGVRPLELEWDITVRRYVYEHPNIWSVFRALAEAGQLKQCHFILFSLHVTLIGFWSRETDSEEASKKRIWELWATRTLVDLYCRSRYLPPSFDHLPTVFRIVRCQDVCAILLNVVWKYLHSSPLNIPLELPRPKPGDEYTGPVRHALRRVLGEAGWKGETAVCMYPLFFC